MSNSILEGIAIEADEPKATAKALQSEALKSVADVYAKNVFDLLGLLSLPYAMLRIAARDLENTLEDLVSIFEAALKFEIRRYLKANGNSSDQIDAAMKKIGSRLQSVSHAVPIIPEFCDGILLFAAGSADESKLNRVFQKRHPITHNLGVVDRKYIERVRSGEAEGTEVRVENNEILETAKITYSVLSEFHSKLFPVAST